MKKPPKCHDCGTRTMRVVSRGGGHEFLCASCEHLRGHPTAERAVPMPRERRPKKLQSERLFEVA